MGPVKVKYGVQLTDQWKDQAWPNLKSCYGVSRLTYIIKFRPLFNHVVKVMLSMQGSISYAKGATTANAVPIWHFNRSPNDFNAVGTSQLWLNSGCFCLTNLFRVII